MCLPAGPPGLLGKSGPGVSSSFSTKPAPSWGLLGRLSVLWAGQARRERKFLAQKQPVERHRDGAAPSPSLLRNPTCMTLGGHSCILHPFMPQLLTEHLLCALLCTGQGSHHVEIAQYLLSGAVFLLGKKVTKDDLIIIEIEVTRHKQRDLAWSWRRGYRAHRNREACLSSGTQGCCPSGWRFISFSPDAEILVCTQCLAGRQRDAGRGTGTPSA